MRLIFDAVKAGVNEATTQRYERGLKAILDENDGFYRKMLEGYLARHIERYGSTSMEKYMEQIGLFDFRKPNMERHKDLDLARHKLHRLHVWDSTPNPLYSFPLTPAGHAGRMPV